EVWWGVKGAARGDGRMASRHSRLRLLHSLGAFQAGHTNNQPSQPSNAQKAPSACIPFAWFGFVVSINHNLLAGAIRPKVQASLEGNKSSLLVASTGCILSPGYWSNNASNGATMCIEQSKIGPWDGTNERK
ncbi:hypothetical protein CLAIMM_06273, partial [Cladophialophora immunda]